MPYTKEKNKSKVIDRKEMEDRRQDRQKQRKQKLIILAAALACILILVFFIAGGYERLLDLFGIERDISVKPSITEFNVDLKGTTLITGVGETTIVYDENGMTGYSKDGKWKWNETCVFSNPSVYTYDKFVIFADIGGTAAYAFNENGNTWRFGGNNKIKAVFAGSSDCVCIIHEESEYLSAVSVYKYDGKTSSLSELFTRKFSSHYMLSGSVSDDGKQIALSGVYPSGGETAGIISFLRVSDGEIVSNEVIQNQIYVKEFYAENGSLFAVNSDSVRILKCNMSISSENDINTEVWNRESKQEKIIDAVLLNNKQCVIAVGSENSSKTNVIGYTTKGKESLNIEISGNIIGMDSVGDGLLVYTEKDVYLYNEKGLLIGTQEAGFAIEEAVCTGSRYVTVRGEGKLLSVSFK